MVAATDTVGLAAIVLLAAPARPGREGLRWRARTQLAVNAALSDAQRDSIAALRVARIDSSAGPGSWMRSYLEYDPLPAARRLRTPVLVLQGATDQQVAPAEAEELAAAIRAAGNARVVVEVLPGVNHMFLTDSVGRPSGYAQPASRQLDPRVLQRLTDWLTQQLVR